MSHANGFALPSLPNTSTSSLLDAVVGGRTQPAAGAPQLGRLAEEPLGDASARVNHRAGNHHHNNGGNNGAPQQSEAEVAELERKLEKR